MSGSAQGRLVLMPNTLDLGNEAVDLVDVVPLGAIRRAAGLRFWAAENARSTRAFLKRVNAVQPLVHVLQSIDIQELPRPRKGSPHPGPQHQSAETGALARLLEPALAGHDIGLISEAGLPGVADPGADLVAEAHRQGIAVETWCGPSALTLALAASGLNGQSFAFAGYLPVDAAARAARIRELEAASRRTRQTQLFIETPYRNPVMLDTLLNSLAESTRLSVSCGLSLPTGWTRTATAGEWRKSPRPLPSDTPAVFLFLAG
jgi:16S rRNA (cytidine1402-2'-O)-methyltransferase